MAKRRERIPRAIGEEVEADALRTEYLAAEDECRFSSAQSQSSSEERIGVLMAVFMEWIVRIF